MSACACGSHQSYDACCGRYIEGKTPAPTAEALMRSRYTAYARGHEAYLLATWHPDYRPKALNLSADVATHWLGLTVRRHLYDTAAPDAATVEFVARFKVGGARVERLHEISRFVRIQGRWFYVDGTIPTRS